MVLDPPSTSLPQAHHELVSTLQPLAVISTELVSILLPSTSTLIPTPMSVGLPPASKFSIRTL
jgi:hypothetical protein